MSQALFESTITSLPLIAKGKVRDIYAVGDVTDRINLTPVAIREGHAFADTVFGGQPTMVDYDCVASAVFTTPEVGTVGLTEAAAQEKPFKISAIRMIG